ncbi:MAG: hypothetical protein M3395_02795 [Chloroflexota bacterium]|nr:hypothetical protein [Chloroflexota bacterium]
MNRKSWSTGIVGSALLTLALINPVAAAPGNEVGDTLVNVQISDVTIAVPIAIAANLCDINVNALSDQVDAGDTECTATAESIATPGSNGGNGGNGNQAGNSLVNVQITDIEVLVPIALAANLCDVNVNVLARQLRLGEATCDASALAVTEPA